MAALLSLALLLAAAAAASDSQGSCDKHVRPGEPFQVPLGHTWQPGESLMWKHNSTRIFYLRPSGEVAPGRMEDVSEDGALLLRSVGAKDAGVYWGEVFNQDGKRKHHRDYRLCVHDPVSKPTVKVKCEPTFVTFTCETSEKDVVWLRNDQVTSESKNPLKVATTEKQKEAISCKVSNQVSEAISDPASDPCLQEAKVEEPRTLLGLEFTTMILILSAGGGFVLMLLVILIVCCVCARRRKNMHVKDEEEFRLTWARAEEQKQQSHPSVAAHQHHSHGRPQKSQQHPPGNTGPRAHSSERKKPRQGASRGPQANPRRHAQVQSPRQPSGEQPPPVPQPRRQGAKPPRA